MQHDEIAKILSEWQTTLEGMDEQVNKLADFLRCGLEAPLFEATSTLADKYTKAIAEKVGDTSKWLEWYWLENDMGNAGLHAVLAGKETKVRTAGELASVICHVAST
jgi:hypothetical protein